MSEPSSDHGTAQGSGSRSGGEKGLRARAARLADPHGLQERVARLEAEAAETRALSLRIAELTDLVSELVVPLARQDPELAATLLTRYQDGLGS